MNHLMRLLVTKKWVLPKIIELSKSSERYQDTHAPHEAGFDAYMTGFAFIKVVTSLSI